MEDFIANDGKQYKILGDHIVYQNGNMKTVCASAVIGYFDIPIGSYRFTYKLSTKENRDRSIIEKHGYQTFDIRDYVFRENDNWVQFHILKHRAKEYAKNNQLKGGYYLIGLEDNQTGDFHVVLTDLDGNVLVDTVPGEKMDLRHVYEIDLIIKNN